jgi:hypothetical protein
MVTEPEEEGAVYVAVQAADARAHVLEAKEPPAPPSLHVMVPEGVVGELLVSVTLAAKVIELPAVTEDGFGETPVAVE